MVGVPSDSSPPISIATQSPAANADGWSASNVSIHISATDPDGASDVASIQYSASGANHSRDGGAGRHRVHRHYRRERDDAQLLCARPRWEHRSRAFAGGPDRPDGADRDLRGQCGHLWRGPSYFDRLQRGGPRQWQRTPGSGIASNTCADIAAPAYTFAAGINTFSATATDRAGNIGTSSASFTLQVAPGGLCNLTTGFIEGSPRFAALPPADRPPLVTAGAQLCNALSGATLPAPQKAFYIGIYQRGVMALATWGWLSSDQAAALVAAVSGTLTQRD